MLKLVRIVLIIVMFDLTSSSIFAVNIAVIDTDVFDPSFANGYLCE